MFKKIFSSKTGETTLVKGNNTYIDPVSGDSAFHKDGSTILDAGGNKVAYIDTYQTVRDNAGQPVAYLTDTGVLSASGDPWLECED